MSIWEVFKQVRLHPGIRKRHWKADVETLGRQDEVSAISRINTRAPCGLCQGTQRAAVAQVSSTGYNHCNKMLSSEDCESFEELQ